MGAKEEEIGNVVAGPAIIGEPWWLIKVGATEFCCHVAGSWFAARKVGRELTGEECISATLIFR